LIKNVATQAKKDASKKLNHKSTFKGFYDLPNPTNIIIGITFVFLYKTDFYDFK